MLALYNQIQESVHFIRSRWNGVAKAGIVLGTGLGNLAKQITADVTLPYEEIPHFPQSTVTTHAGNLVIGKLNGVNVIVMEGRFHAYEGYDLKQITFPIRVIQALGADTLFVSNACGGMNPQYQQGDIMVIEDHINLMGVNPLVGINDDRLGTRFPDLCEPYDKKMIDQALEIARKENFVAHKGVYVGVLGPNLETRAEYRFLRGIGADVVGMSTVPEVLVAIHCGMKVLGLSIVTDMALPDALKPGNVSEIIATANAAEPKLTKIVCGVLRQLPPKTAC
ncbi:MAG: purine-nucleoside phosphorylase [Planctomycetaceae bacterium]|jgi:purine-nucleoside phosphorylase|nr:purine-nucleoside phosphorylase [Planctomycetaceae bacterium]